MISPTDLFIEPATGDIYWSDNTKDTIERCSWNGSNRLVIKSTKLPSVKSIFVQENKVYYADSRLKGMYSFDITNLSNISDSTLIKRVSSNSLNNLLIFNEKSQPENISSACKNSAGQSLCDQLCFPLPDGERDHFVCSCAVGDLNGDGRTCKRPDEYLIFAMENEIRSVNLPKGSNDEGHVSGMPWKPITGLRKAIGIDFDFRDKKIIFSDIYQRKVSSVLITSENPIINDMISQNRTLRRQLIRKPEGK